MGITIVEKDSDDLDTGYDVIMYLRKAGFTKSMVIIERLR